MLCIYITLVRFIVYPFQNTYYIICYYLVYSKTEPVNQPCNEQFFSFASKKSTLITLKYKILLETHCHKLTKTKTLSTT